MALRISLTQDGRTLERRTSIHCDLLTMLPADGSTPLERLQARQVASWRNCAHLPARPQRTDTETHAAVQADMRSLRERIMHGAPRPVPKRQAMEARMDVEDVQRRMLDEYCNDEHALTDGLAARERDVLAMARHCSWASVPTVQADMAAHVRLYRAQLQRDIATERVLQFQWMLALYERASRILIARMLRGMPSVTAPNMHTLDCDNGGECKCGPHGSVETPWCEHHGQFTHCNCDVNGPVRGEVMHMAS